MKKIIIISIAMLIFIVGVSFASAADLDLEKGTNAPVDKMVKNNGNIHVSSSNVLGSSANTKQDPGSGTGCVGPLGSSANTKQDPGSGMGSVKPYPVSCSNVLGSSANTKQNPGSGTGCVGLLGSSANTKQDPGSGMGCAKQ